MYAFYLSFLPYCAGASRMILHSSWESEQLCLVLYFGKASIQSFIIEFDVSHDIFVDTLNQVKQVLL